MHSTLQGACQESRDEFRVTQTNDVLPHPKPRWSMVEPSVVMPRLPPPPTLVRLTCP